MNVPVFGPVPSRRFGQSLGVNPVPRKTCNYSCIYCQLGKTTGLAADRNEYIGTSEVVDAIRAALEQAPDNIDFITFMGEGEPTLASNLGEMAKAIRSFWDGKLALITNGSLFFLPEVREAAMSFDVVSPTFVAGDERTYRRIHRPHRSCTLSRMVEGMREFRKGFKGEIWAEVMLIQGINDSIESLQVISSLIKEVKPDRIYINTPIRPPSDTKVSPPTRESLQLALQIIEGAIDLSSPEGLEFPANQDPISQILTIAANHPLREDQAIHILRKKVSPLEAVKILDGLVAEGRLEKMRHVDTSFYRAPLRRD